MASLPDLAVRDGDVGRHVDEVAEDQARLGIPRIRLAMRR